MTSPVAVLTRRPHREDCTLGSLALPGGLTLYTMEPPWRDNRRGVSCIPEGRYQLSLGRFNKGKYDTWEVDDVPGRSLIKFHRGNVVTETQGCILVGLAVATRGKPSLLGSKAAHEAMMASLAGIEGLYLEVTRDRLPADGPA